jgi:hypothetical protein
MALDANPAAVVLVAMWLINDVNVYKPLSNVTDTVPAPSSYYIVL